MTKRIPIMVLIVHVPTGENRRIEIRDWRTVIGRSSKTDLKLVGKQISKLHAAIEIEDSVAHIRDLGSRNGVEVNGHLISQPTRLGPGDVLTIGDAQITVDPGSLIFRPPDAQAELHELLRREEQLRRESEQAQYYDSHGMPQPQHIPSRPMVNLNILGHPLANAAGEAPVLRVLRIADGRGPRDEARIEAFLCELDGGQQVWIRPRAAIEVRDLGSFRPAENVWIDEPEDFGGPGAHAMIIARSTYYLPRRISLRGCSPSGRTPDGFDIYSEDGTRAAILLEPVR